ncbi:hypothetical protein DSO57_1038357 [Entomophthora muscae]|uniref:Uncharacterized protein n=1 Tax=Entomophthora muscae TaxID=34485 RepID=A0ACC2SN67_9FUNG|nr:hypothetical protein DSO57_1038357 [Entomophthora muscae]
MVFTSNIFDSASSQASFNGGKAQNVEAPVYTQAFEAGNEKAGLLLTPDVRIVNSSSLETWAQEQESNPDPGFLWATGPVDCLPAFFWDQAPTS